MERLADCLRRLEPEAAPAAVAYLSGVLPQGSIGVGWATLRALPPAAPEPGTLQLLEVDAALTRIGRATGPGSRALRRRLLDELFARATEAERGYLIRLLTGELRQGALERIMVEALARASGAAASAVRRAVMVAGDLGPVAAAALAEGAPGLTRFRLEVLQPIGPMLAQTAADIGEATTGSRPPGQFTRAGGKLGSDAKGPARGRSRMGGT